MRKIQTRANTNLNNAPMGTRDYFFSLFVKRFGAARTVDHMG
jgi:hypothetical protein